MAPEVRAEPGPVKEEGRFDLLREGNKRVLQFLVVDALRIEPGAQREVGALNGAMHLVAVELEVALEPFQLEIAPGLQRVNDVEFVCHAGDQHSESTDQSVTIPSRCASAA